MDPNNPNKKKPSIRITSAKTKKPLETSISTQNTDGLDSTRSFEPNGDEIKKYAREFNDLNNFLDTMIDLKTLKTTEVGKLKEFLNSVTVNVQDWKRLPPEIQDQFRREELLSKVVLLIQHEDVKLKFRVIRACLVIIKNLGFAEYLANSKTSSFSVDRMDSDSSFVKYSDQEEAGQAGQIAPELFMVLKNLSKLSKESQNDGLFIQEGLLPYLMEILQTIPTIKEEFPANLLISLLTTLKNICGNEEIRNKSLETKNCKHYSNLLGYLNEITKNLKKKNEDVYNVLYQLTACLRNLTTNANCIAAYYETGVITGLCDAIGYNMQEADLVLNCLRILSKLSLNKDCCHKIVEKEDTIVNFIKILDTHRNGLFIVIRTSFILANITTYIEKMREHLYFDLKIFPELLKCFDFYLKKGGDMSRAQEMDKVMRTSFAKFDKTSANESNQDAIMKLVRLMANLFTLEEIGTDFVAKYSIQYKYLLRHVCVIIKDKEIGSNATTELLVSGLSFLANAMFFEKPTTLHEDFELKTLKTEILFTLSRFIIQKDNDEICCEALRVLSNLSRDRSLAKQITKTKLIEAVIALLGHDNKDIVYYSLGVIMNLMLTDDMKKVEIQQTILKSVTNILFYSTIEDFDIVSCCLKCATNILDTLDKPNIDGDTLKTFEELVVNYGEQCDVIMAKDRNDNEASDIRGIINHLLNIMPEEGYNCPDQSCGRKFKSKQELIKHVTRRHPNPK